MKFSDIEQDKWQALKPYLDTVVIPVTGLTGIESPDEATKQLEHLRDWLDLVEQPFHGRIVTYPAIHFISQDWNINVLHEFINNLKTQGFKYVVAVTAKHTLALHDIGFDAVISPTTEDENPLATQVQTTIINMWQK